jgi:hypothetical protein
MILDSFSKLKYSKLTRLNLGKFHIYPQNLKLSIFCHMSRVCQPTMSAVTNGIDD